MMFMFYICYLNLFTYTGVDDVHVLFTYTGVDDVHVLFTYTGVDDVHVLYMLFEFIYIYWS
jgi:hypothetical protein